MKVLKEEKKIRIWELWGEIDLHQVKKVLLEHNMVERTVNMIMKEEIETGMELSSSQDGEALMLGEEEVVGKRKDRSKIVDLVVLVLAPGDVRAATRSTFKVGLSAKDAASWKQTREPKSSRALIRCSKPGTRTTTSGRCPTRATPTGSMWPTTPPRWRP